MYLISDETLTRSPLLRDEVFKPKPNGVLMGLGAVPREETELPEMPSFVGDAPSGITIFEESEWDARIDELEANRATVNHLRPRGWKSYDQNGHGYCWMYSTSAANSYARFIANLPLVRFNPHAGAAIVKGGRDEGGWCGLSLKFVREHGIALETDWPGHSLSLSNDTPTLRASMKKYRTREDWYDVAKAEWDQKMTFKMIASCLLQGIPLACDFDWWGHSVCITKLVRIERGHYGLHGINSWTDAWGENGEFTLSEEKSRPMGAVGVRVVSPSAAYASLMRGKPAMSA